MENLQKQIESIRRWRWLVVGAAVAGLVVAAVIALAGSTTYSSTATAVVGTAATQAESGQAPEQDAVLARGYVELINAGDQDAIREAAGTPGDVTISAAPVANSPFIDITATAGDADTATASAQAFTDAFIARTYATFNRIVTDRLAPLRARYRALNAEIATTRQQLQSDSLGAAERAELEGELAAQQAEAQGLSAQIEQQAAVAGNPNLAGLYQEAGSAVATSPSVVRNAVLGLIGGLIVGVAAALLLGSLGLRLRTPADVRERLGLATLGTIARTDAAADGGSPEEYRAIADRLAVLRPPVGTVAVVSPGDDDGAAGIVAAQLAAERAAQGEQVILINADARHVGARGRSSESRAVRGLAELLSGEDAPLERYLQPGGQEGLRVLRPGRTPADARTVLSTDALRSVIEEASSQADLVVIDAPPLLTAAESRLICAAVDGTVMVVDAVATRPKDALEARELLTGDGTALVGVVLSRVSSTSVLH